MNTVDQALLDALRTMKLAEIEVRRDMERHNTRLMSNWQQPSWPAYAAAQEAYSAALDAWLRANGLRVSDAEIIAQVNSERTGGG